MQMGHGMKTQSHIRSSYYMRSPFYPSHDEQAALLEDRRNRLAEEAARRSPPTSPIAATPTSAADTPVTVTNTDINTDASNRSYICHSTPPLTATEEHTNIFLSPGNDSDTASPDPKKLLARSGRGLSSYELYAAREAQVLTVGASRLAIGSPGLTLTGSPRQPRAITGRRGSLTASLSGGSSTATPGSSTPNTSASTSTCNLNDSDLGPPSNISVLTSCSLADDATAPPTFSRKVFVGGLPIDIIDDDITRHFVTYGSVKVDWPHKVESKAVFPPKGFAFLHFKAEPSVKALLDASTQEDGHFFSHVLSPRGGWKRVEIIPWLLQDADYSIMPVEELDPRKTVFVGGVPRPCTASKLASIMDSLFSNVVYAGIDTDLDFQYPKGSGRVCFCSKNSFVNAISSRFVEVVIGASKKRVEIKPYILDEQICDICHGNNTDEKYAAFYCNHVSCLKYHCSQCWAKIHCLPEFKFHKPLIKEARNGLHDMTFM